MMKFRLERNNNPRGLIVVTGQSKRTMPGTSNHMPHIAGLRDRNGEMFAAIKTMFKRLRLRQSVWTLTVVTILGIASVQAVSMGPVLSIRTDGGVAESAKSDQGGALSVVDALIEKRLDLMTEVAKSKWNSGAPVEDAAREQKLLQVVEVQSKQAGLPPGWVAHFFRFQIEAAKEAQYALFAQWREQRRGKLAQSRDLATEIRPELDLLTPQLIAALAKAWPLLVSGNAKQPLTHLKAVAPRSISSYLAHLPLRDGSANAYARTLDTAEHP